jgi:hypothetical protein
MSDWRVQEARNEARFRVQNESTSEAGGAADGPTRRPMFVCRPVEER